ncbi:MAG TPA: AMP-binding protein [Casimicrobiaceae bacterium]|nr:AMP-binding protein [Casimicrobiaceae bacterium]
MSQPVADVVANAAATLIDSLIASNKGDRPAFEYAKKTYSYQDLAALMNRTGNMLQAMGMADNARVLLLLPESPAFVAALLGAIKAGAVPVVGAPTDDDGLGRCVSAVQPAVAIVHEQTIGTVARGLGTLPHDAIIVAGQASDGYKSFAAEIRMQPSWLVAAPVESDAPALGAWSGSSLVTASHADVAALVARDVAMDRAIAMLRMFAEGAQATFR